MLVKNGREEWRGRRKGRGGGDNGGLRRYGQEKHVRRSV
jgi:hypothetical protein